MLEDYEDFLRNNQLPAWEKNHPLAQRLTGRSRQAEEVYATYRADIEHDSPEISANTIRHLILQAVFLLTRQIQNLEQEFLKNGGIRERMTAARRDTRDATAASPAPTPTTPLCPLCGADMRRRTARAGSHAGNLFWGCSSYPECRGTRPMEKA